MNSLEEKSAKLRYFIIFCAAAAITALAFAMSGWYNIWMLSVALIAAVFIFFAVLSHKKMYDDAIRDSAEHINALERNLKFFRDIYELNPNMLFLIDERFRMTDFNKAASEYVGADDKQSMLDDLSNRIEADIPKITLEDGFTESLLKKMGEAARDDFSHLFTVFKKRDDTYRNISVAFSRISSENSFVLVGSVTDVTELYDLKGDLKRKNEMLDLINRIAVLISSQATGNNNDMSRRDLLRKAAEIMGHAVDADRIYLSRNRIIDGIPRFTPEFAWISPSSGNSAMKPEESREYMVNIPAWEERFRKGECVNGPFGAFSGKEHEILEQFGVKSILALPLFLNGELWGLMSFDDCRKERAFAEEDINILRSAGLMMAAYLKQDGAEHEMTPETL